MIKLVIHVIGVDPAMGVEVSLARVEVDQFDPGLLDGQIVKALDSASVLVTRSNLNGLRAWLPEVSAVLTADDDEVRPSLHLSAETLRKLAEVGASFDFDPYV